MNWPKLHRFAALDRRDHQLALAVLALQVDRQTEVGVRGRDRVRLAVDLGEVPVHVRELLDRLHDRVAQQVGERDLAAAGALEVVVDDDAVVDHQLGRDGAHAGRGRHVQRRRHVLDDGRGGAAQHLGLVAVGGGRRLGRLRRLGLGGRGVGLGGGGLRRGGGGGFLAGAASASRRAGSAALGSARRCPGGLRRRGGSGFGGAVGCDVVADAGPSAAVDVTRSIRGSSRRGTRANSGRPRRDPRGTCGTSPRPSHSFCPNGEVELLTAAARLDSFCFGKHPHGTPARLFPSSLRLPRISAA